MSAVPGAAGFFGKVRTRGDFVGRRLPPVFLETWDARLQAGLLASRAALGGDWLAAYLVAPVWCFALGAGVCGEGAWAGVLLPGVDRAGRHFPFTVAAPLAATHLDAWLVHAEPWYDACIEAALTTLDPHFALVRFDRRLAALAELGAVAASTAPGTPFGTLLARTARAGASLWWTDGSERLHPVLRRCPGLPDAARFATLLTDPTAGTPVAWPWEQAR